MSKVFYTDMRTRPDRNLLNKIETLLDRMKINKGIKKNDLVEVIAGNEKGKRGKVLRVLGDERVVVEGVNLVTKAERKSPKNPEGGLIKREGAIHLSNVMLASVYDASPRRKTAKTQ